MKRARLLGYAAVPVMFLGQFAPSQCTPQPRCHPNYAGHCLPIVGDLDCPQVPGPVRIVGADPYRLDRDNDGIGCERD